MKPTAPIALASCLYVSTSWAQSLSGPGTSGSKTAPEIMDCNGNGIPDARELSMGLVPDVNRNLIPDDCEHSGALPYGIRELVVFGDSLSDTGNLYQQYGVPYSPPYFEGRFSNGPVWIEYLAGFLGIPVSGVQNYALGGATTGRDNTSFPEAGGLLDEIDLYAQSVAANGPPDPRTLFVLWTGPNDFSFEGDINQLGPIEDLIAGAMANIETAIRELVDLGAGRILVPNLPDLGATPLVRELGDPAASSLARTGTIAFNSNLAWLLANLEHELDVDIFYFDVFALFEDAVSNPARYRLVDVEHRGLDPSEVQRTGLMAEIYHNRDLSDLALTRFDATVDFDWHAGSPDPSVGSDTFSIAWSGFLESGLTETYTLYTVSDDGVRLWVDDQLVIDQWRDQAAAQHSGTVQLVAGQRVPIRLEYYENGGQASCRLEWSAPGLAREVIPSASLTQPRAGLVAEIYDDIGSTQLATSRVDAKVDFNWHQGSPIPSVGSETFSVVWSGILEPEVTGTHTLYTISDDGVRLWVDEELVIDHWFDQPATQRSGTVQLIAGQRIPIRLEYYENGNEASCRLEWSAPGLPREVIPSGNLMPPMDSANARGYLFWDEVHPTTKAHRILALGGQSAVLSGGKRLPAPPCLGCPTATIELFGVEYDFTEESTYTVSGRVVTSGLPLGAVQVRIQGEERPLDASGEFLAVVQLSSVDLATTIGAEVSTNGILLDRDRMTVIRGASTRPGEILANNAGVHVTPAGVRRIRDEIVHHLEDQGLRQQLNQAAQNRFGGHINGDPCGIWWDLNILGASYGCLSIDVEPDQDLLLLRINLDQVNVYYDFAAGLSGCPDPGVDCSGALLLPRVTVTAPFRLTPRWDGAVSVTQASPVSIDLPPFFIDGCDFLLEIASIVNFDVGRLVYGGIVSGIGSVTDQLPVLIEDALQGVNLGQALSSSLGLDVQASLSTLEFQGGAVKMGFDVAFGSASDEFPTTYRVPSQQPIHGSVDPGGQPYAFVLSLSQAAINQLLLAESERFLAAHTIDEIDLGGGTRPLTSDLLGALVPSFSLLPQGTALGIRIRPLMPPMILAPTSSTCSSVDAVLGRVSIDVVLADAPPSEPPLFGVEAQLDTCIDVENDTASSELVVRMPASGFRVDVETTQNPARIEEATTELFLESLLQSAIALLGDREVRLSVPSFRGASFPSTAVVPQTGYLSSFLRVDSPHGRPDLVMTLRSPGEVSVNFPFTAEGTIQNIGTQPATAPWPYGAIKSRFRLSVDDRLWNYDEIELGEFVIRGPGGSIQPGEVVPFSFQLGPVPFALPTEQTLFGWIDSGWFVCEGSEHNNLSQASIGVSCPDVYVVSVSPPQNWVGGQLRDYGIRIGRDNVPPESLAVNARVDLFFADGQVWSWNQLVFAPRGGEIDVNVQVEAPDVFTSPGVTFLTRVTLSLPNGFGGVNCDADISNNVRDMWVPIARPYYDLHVSVSGPASARRGERIDYVLTLTNTGNVPSPLSVCGASSVGLFPGGVCNGADAWCPPYSVGPINPGGSRQVTVHDYQIPYNFTPSAQLDPGQDQRIKAVVYLFPSGSCGSDPIDNGNYAEQIIEIY